MILGGGLGGGRMALGLQRLGLLDDSLIAVNVADDHSFYGLHVSPDMDTILYMLSDLIDPFKGWGLRDDTTRTIDSLTELGEVAWFHVGDRDMATHLLRTSMLSRGATLADVAQRLCEAFQLPNVVTPITNDPVRTRITISAGEEVDFQTYHVRLRAGPEVGFVRYEGGERATPAPGILDAVLEARLVILAPSSPVSSILPMLEVPGVRAALAHRAGRTVAVSPIVLGATPDEVVASRSRTCHQLLVGAGYDPTPHSVASLYEDLIDEFIVDTIDAESETSLMPSSIIVRATSTITPTADTAAALIRFILE
jgi:LPPG:FO 2-phospho-L-lactate transferase